MTDKTKRRLCTAVFTLSLISMAVFTVMYVKTQKEYRHSERDIAAVMEIRGAISPALTINEKSRLDEASLRAAEYESAQERREGCRLLKEINQDVAAWITIAGTPIDYPVMQTPDSPDYYYRRGFDGRYSAYGMIYMDAACRLREAEALYEAEAEEGKASPNCVIYGHHMKNGTMFASLEKYGS